MKRQEGEEWRRVRSVARRASVLSSVAGAWSMLVSFVVLRELSRGLEGRSWP